ncbi:uncharacterized protein METZ01_LOCUS249227, partial [marine metagenome]
MKTFSGSVGILTTVLGSGCAGSGPAGEFGLVVMLGLGALVALVVVIEKAKGRRFRIPNARLNNER